MGRSLDLHPVVVMVALAVGRILGGIVGAFLAVPVVAAAAAGIGGWADAAGDGMQALRHRVVVRSRQRRSTVQATS
jgi:hypothetical protein